MSRDPHNNRWGGKDNTWGRRKSNNNSSNGSSYQPTQAFNVFCSIALGILGLAIVTSIGKSILGSIFDKGKEAVDKVTQAKEVVQDIKDIKFSKTGDITLEDWFIDKVVENIKDNLKDSVAIDEVHLVNYTKCDEEDSFKKNVVKKAEKDKGAQLIVIVDTTPTNADEIEEHISNLGNLIDIFNNPSNNELHKQGFSIVKTFTLKNSPVENYLIYTIALW